MSIGVDGVHHRSPVADGTASTETLSTTGAKPGGKGEGSTVAAGDVSLTGSAWLNERIAATIGDGAPMDVARIARLRQAIEAGEYQISPRDIASQLIATESEVFGR